MTRPRMVSDEILDTLPAGDPRAVRSRRDLRRVNRLMSAHHILIRGMRPAVERHARDRPLRLLELGAGDGSLMLRIARSVSRDWPPVQLTLLDRQALVDAAACAAFARCGWTAQPLVMDVLEWAAAPPPRAPSQAPPWDLIVTNLFLHHFDARRLPRLLAAIAARCGAFIACEPRRASLPLLGSRLIGAVGVNSVTRHDAVLSVHAGFRGAEISAAWPADGTGWQLREHAAGLFSQFFSAYRPLGIRQPLAGGGTGAS